MSSSTLSRRIGLGLVLSVDPAGSTSFVPLGSVIDGFKVSGSKAETVDITILADTFKQFGKSQVDPGSMSFTIYYDPADTGTANGTSGILGSMFASTSQVPPNWQITWPAGSTGTTANETFKGFVVGLSKELKVDSKAMCEVEIKLTGNPGFAVSA